MSQSGALGRTWDEASSPAAARLARRFEDDWRRISPGGRPPKPDDYIPSDPCEQSGAWLALLRAELNLRWEAREPVLVESIRARYPNLDEQILVALVYEEFCLREESGLAPDPVEYERRFPELASQLRRVLEIHELVGGSASVAPTVSIRSGGVSDPGPSFPERGETIGGFRLVEELGRGAFARVFLAQERQLADRPVALKVARTGSREPQTLARLQHTHIVPVHSYRIDPATRLHLLCMPYFGRVTLAMILSDASLDRTQGGTDVLRVLDRLQASGIETEEETARSGVAGSGGSMPAGRRALAERSFPGAVAWWGARLAEALQHAHDRGVLHRDLKPSNVLVTADAMPMLLDFNLAQTLLIDEVERGQGGKLGGTLAYMAPEHLEALADGVDEGGDARADLFALGVVLYETLAGELPFPRPRDARSMPEVLLRTAESRRGRPPSLSKVVWGISPALDAIVQRCLAADPADRYACAADLADDLQAIADDHPLIHAREPVVSRSIRWVRRNRVKFALAAPFLAAAAVLAATFHDTRVERVQEQGRIRNILSEGQWLEQHGDLSGAIGSFETVQRLTEGRPEFEDLARRAREKIWLTSETRNWRARADELIEEADDLCYRLLGFVDDGRSPETVVAEVLDPFYVLQNPDWATAPHMVLLRDDQKNSLIASVNQVLYLWLAHEQILGNASIALKPAQKELFRRVSNDLPASDPRRAPWLALLARMDGKTPGEAIPPGEVLENDPAWSKATASVRSESAFFWGVYHGVRYQGEETAEHREWAVAWLELACREQPDNYWARFFLTQASIELNRLDIGLEHADVVVALRPSEAWARFNRSEVYRKRGELNLALADLQFALDHLPPNDSSQVLDRIRLNLGLVRQDLGDMADAQRLYDAVVRESQDERFVMAARLNRAQLFVRMGRMAEANAEYNYLLAQEPDFRQARWGRAELALHEDRLDDAKGDLDHLLRSSDPLPEWYALRARVYLMQGDPEKARGDAEVAVARRPSPELQRLLLRTLLAEHAADRIRLDDPLQLDLLPLAGPSLARDLRIVAELLREPGKAAETSAVPRLLTRVILLSELGDPEGERELHRALAIAPDSVKPQLVRARLALRSNDLDETMQAVTEGLSLQPADVRLLSIRGQLLVRRGEASAALADLDRALLGGHDDAATRAARAHALVALGRLRAAFVEWTRALGHDEADPVARLERARLLLKLGSTDMAMQDLESAMNYAQDRPELRGTIALWSSTLFSTSPSVIERLGHWMNETRPDLLEEVWPLLMP